MSIDSRQLNIQTYITDELEPHTLDVQGMVRDLNLSAKFPLTSHPPAHPHYLCSQRSQSTERLASNKVM